MVASRPDAGADAAAGSDTAARAPDAGVFVEDEFVGAFSPIQIEFVPQGVKSC